MWYKVRELQSKGLNKTQIGKHLGVDRSTVRKYLQMSREDFVRRRNSHRKYTLKLAGYEEYVRGTLEEYPYISAARMHDWLRECYPDFPKVCDKTVFNFVENIAPIQEIDTANCIHFKLNSVVLNIHIDKKDNAKTNIIAFNIYFSFILL